MSQLTFDPKLGLVAPETESVREAVRSDWQDAFRDVDVELNVEPSTPAGQLVDAETAEIEAKNAELLFLANMFNPKVSEGRWQDALGHIYFLTRKIAQSGDAKARQEMDVLERYSGVVKPMATLSPVCSAADVIAMQEMVTQIYCSPEVRSYVATIAAATRQDAALQLGASTRAAIALIHGAQACALLAGRDYIVPEDVQHMAVQVLAHRLVLSPEARMKGVTPESVVRRIIQNTPVPVKL